jgi:hypothetical protein
MCQAFLGSHVRGASLGASLSLYSEKWTPTKDSAMQFSKPFVNSMEVKLPRLCTDYNSPNTWTGFENYLSFVPVTQCDIPLSVLNILVDKPCLIF